jgi:hypothetical protein
MTTTSEIKCPHCSQWTTWTGKIDEKCHSCNGILDPHRFSHEAEKHIKKAENPKKADFFPPNPNDGPVTRELKGFVNAMGWIVFYSEVAFYACVIGVIVILGFVAG